MAADWARPPVVHVSSSDLVSVRQASRRYGPVGDPRRVSGSRGPWSQYRILARRLPLRYGACAARESAVARPRAEPAASAALVRPRRICSARAHAPAAELEDRSHGRSRPDEMRRIRREPLQADEHVIGCLNDGDTGTLCVVAGPFMLERAAHEEHVAAMLEGDPGLHA